MESDVFTVPDSHPGQRLDAYLRERYTQSSRGEIQRLVRNGWVQVNGHLAKPAQAPRAGDVIEIRWPTAEPTEVLAQEMPLDILFEDSDLVVLNKSADVVVHPAAGHADGTLVNALLYHCRGNLSGIGGVERPGIVHRLDLGTSGCLVVAKNDFTHRSLQEQFATRRVEKTYQCIVCGKLDPGAGEIRAPIGRHPSHRKRMAVTEPGKPGRTAWTSYQLLERLFESTFAEARLHTGRTHQIRVHFQHIGFPLAGDDVYGRGPNKRLRELSGIGIDRQMLHARRLAFKHPRSGAWVEFDARLPDDFQFILAALRERSNAERRPSGVILSNQVPVHQPFQRSQR